MTGNEVRNVGVGLACSPSSLINCCRMRLRSCSKLSSLQAVLRAITFSWYYILRFMFAIVFWFSWNSALRLYSSNYLRSYDSFLAVSDGLTSVLSFNLVAIRFSLILEGCFFFLWWKDWVSGKCSGIYGNSPVYRTTCM